jgi:hypothetical protein
MLALWAFRRGRGRETRLAQSLPHEFVHRGMVMYVALTMNALNYFPHTLPFETVRPDAIRRHNWSPGYYGTSDDSLGHCLDEIATSDLAQPAGPTAPRRAAPDADLEVADA